ncbi:MAG TPA: SGNH/GDSL hydrolase family protein [Steroidobacteraceae bacterium]|nr:SGNH/GDSL hydrolase family protein [Steroidobacteraceae bacterium]
MAVSSFITRTLAFLAGIAGALLALELVLRVLPVLSGTYAADPRAAWPVHTMIPHSSFTYSTGWNLQNIQRGRINNYGYVAPFDYEPGTGDAIAVFGDSYVEAQMNDYDDTLQGSLNDYLKTPRTVLNFGSAGAEMPDYLGIAPLVRRDFSPQWAVVVITMGDFTRGFSAGPGYFKWQPGQSPPVKLVPEIHRSALSKWLRTVALIRYSRGNLSVRPGELIQLRRGAVVAEGASPCHNEVLSKDDETLLEAFARELPPALGLPPGRVILIFDSDRKAIYAGKTRDEARKCLTRAARANDRLQELAAQSGIHVIDSYDTFARHFADRLGPLDRSPLDAHWNPAAHRLMAREVARIIDR